MFATAVMSAVFYNRVSYVVFHRAVWTRRPSGTVAKSALDFSTRCTALALAVYS